MTAMDRLVLAIVLGLWMNAACNVIAQAAGPQTDTTTGSVVVTTCSTPPELMELIVEVRPLAPVAEEDFSSNVDASVIAVCVQ